MRPASVMNPTLRRVAPGRGPAAALIVAALIPLLSACSLLRAGLDAPNPRQPWLGFEDAPLPRVVRYISSLPARRGQVSYGLVLGDDRGIPATVLNLNLIEPRLGSDILTFNQNGGFDLADRLAASPEERAGHAAAVETLDPDHLADVILPIVKITEQDLETGRRVSVGVGLNYGEHRTEAAAEHIDKTLFPKFTPTTGAYAPVSLGVQVDEPEKPVLLGDYEVEIGFVVLEDIDLANPPADPEVFGRSVAYFAANDVSDREPIIRDRYLGFTQGKSHPTYQPIGPWMIHGRHLWPRTMREGRDPLHLQLLVQEAEPAPGGALRQADLSTSMIRGPHEILLMIAEIWKDCAMLDAAGTLRPLVPERDGKPVLPAGSIVLTGTPGGTAIRAPGTGDLFRLLALGGFSVKGALEAYVGHCETHRKEMGFLHAGDVVETRVQHLGRQRWTVVD